MFTIEELATIPLFSTLGDKELEYLAGAVEDIHLIPGEYVGHEGEGRSLAIVVEGKTELTKLVNGVEKVIAVRLPGEVGGEIPMILGTPLPASMRAVEPSRVLKVTVEVFHTLAAMAPQVSETLGAAALERMGMLRNATAHPREPAMFVIGPRVDPGVHDCDSFLHRNQIPYDRLDPDDPAALERSGGKPAAFPVVVLRDGTQLSCPDDACRCHGRWTDGRAKPDALRRGDRGRRASGPDGGGQRRLRRAADRTDRILRPRRQAGTSTRIENYTGFPFGVSGDELATRTLQQAKRLGAEIVVTRQVEGIDPAELTVTLDGGDVLRTTSIVLAMGVEWRRLRVDSIDRFVGSGVYYGAARSDAGLAQGNDVYLIGAGNLPAKPPSSSPTTPDRSRSSCGASHSPKHVALPHRANRDKGEHPGGNAIRGCRRARRRTTRGDRGHRSKTGTTSRRDAKVLFVLIGAEAATDWLPPEISRDEHGFVLPGTDAMKAGRWKADREPFALETSAPGIFAVGDIRSGSVKRVAASVGEGGMAIAHVHRYLQLPR